MNFQKFIFRTHACTQEWLVYLLQKNRGSVNLTSGHSCDIACSLYSVSFLPLRKNLLRFDKRKADYYYTTSPIGWSAAVVSCNS